MSKDGLGPLGIGNFLNWMYLRGYIWRSTSPQITPIGPYSPLTESSIAHNLLTCRVVLVGVNTTITSSTSYSHGPAQATSRFWVTDLWGNAFKHAVACCAVWVATVTSCTLVTGGVVLVSFLTGAAIRTANVQVAKTRTSTITHLDFFSSTFKLF